MLPQSLVKEALGIALSTGADYAEVFAEHTNQKAIQIGKVLKSHKVSGYG